MSGKRKIKKRIIPANIVVPAMNQLTGMLSKIGIILILLYFAVFSKVSQVAAGGLDYNLAYPGMLPDSPFYFLKVARDNFVGWFITDPTQKSFYLLLQSDKRIFAGALLVQKGDKDLAAATFLKGEEYFKQAVGLAEQKRSDDLLAKLVVAGAKHAEILEKTTGVDTTKALADDAESRKRIMELYLAK